MYRRGFVCNKKIKISKYVNNHIIIFAKKKKKCFENMKYLKYVFILRLPLKLIHIKKKSTE